jgi:protein-disulfide isomerase
MPRKILHSVLTLDGLASIAMIAASLVMIWTTVRRQPPSRPAIQVPKDPVSVDGAPILGSPTAGVAMIEFTDFECPFCLKFSHDMLPAIRAKYIESGKVRLVFRHLPLPIHSHAKRAAIVSECAAQQGKFWDLHDRLFAPPRDLSEAALVTMVASIGMNAEAATKCLDKSDDVRIDSDVKLASSLGISSTPTFLIGSVTATGAVAVKNVIEGARDVEVFANAFDGALKAR